MHAGQSASAHGNKNSANFIPLEGVCFQGGIFLKNARLSFILAWLAAALGGSALHFLYVLVPHPLIALFSPVNESVWEHLKLLYYPTLLAAFVLSRRTEEKHRLWGGFFAALLVMPAVLVGVYYTLFSGFGVAYLWVDIALYFLTMAGGFALACALFRSGRAERSAGVLLMLVIFYGAFLIVFSFAAPSLGIFASPQ